MNIGSETRQLVCEPLRSGHATPRGDWEATNTRPPGVHTSGDRAPDGIEPVVAWRFWHVSFDGSAARLTGVSGSDCWPAGQPLVAACRTLPGLHPAPRRGCTCGIHATQAPGDATRYADLAGQEEHFVAFGSVAVWGAVVEAERGWRASHAYPLGIVLLAPQLATSQERAAAAFSLVADYGIPVQTMHGSRTEIARQPMLSWVFGRGPTARQFPRGVFPQCASAPLAPAVTLSGVRL